MNYAKAHNLHQNKILFMVIGAFSFFFVFFLLNTEASAISGACRTHPCTTIPGETASNTVVQISDEPIKMKARTTIANIYVPSTVTGNIQLTIIDGCDNGTRDNVLENNANTQFFIPNGGPSILGDTACAGGGNNFTYTFNADTTPVDFRTEGYKVYLFAANAVGSELNGRYLNAFRIQADTTDVLVGISNKGNYTCAKASYPNSCPRLRDIGGVVASYVFSSFYGDSANGYYGQQILINNKCRLENNVIRLYDLDANDNSLAQNIRIRLYKTVGGVEQQQSFTRPDGVVINELDHTTVELWGFAFPGFGGNEDDYMDLPPDATNAGLGAFDANTDYRFEIVGLSRNNAIQMNVSFASCPNETIENVSCSISGPLRISSTATSITIPVNINVPANNAVPASARDSGLHIGIAANGTPATWNATGAPNPPPDNQSRYVAKAAGSGGLSHYQEPSGGFVYNRYFVNSAIAENSSGVVTISVDISQIDQDLVVRLLDRAGGRWLANYCTVKIDRNREPTFAPPTGLGDVNCENFRLSNVDDPDDDNVVVQLQLNDGTILDITNTVPDPTYNLASQAVNNSTFDFSLVPWRDFNSRNFRVLLSDGYDTVYTDNQSVGPCVTMVCGGATVPSNLQVYSPFDISVNFGMRYDYVNSASTGVPGTIGPRGQQITYDVNITVTPAPGAAPGNPVVNDSTIAQGANSTISHAITGYTASPNPTLYDVDYGLVGVNNGNATVSCPVAGETVAFNSANYPYVQAFRGDVIAGYGIKNSAGSCTTNTNALVRASVGTALTNSAEIVGSGTQMAVFASGAVQGFRSAITQTSPSNINNEPWRRIFANVDSGASPPRTVTSATGSGSYGGDFNSSLCAENWFAGMPDTATPLTQNPDNNIADIDVAGVFGIVRYDGDVRLNASVPLTGSRKIYVNGNVIIGDAFPLNQRLEYSTSNWNSVLDIPSFILIVDGGNIIIDDNVVRLDGIYVSSGTVFTCAPTGGLLPTSAQNVVQYSPASFRIGGQCNTYPLSLQGAIIANTVRLWRTGGTLYKSINGDTTGTQDYVDGLTRSETIRLSPEVFVAPRFGEEPTNGSPGRKQLDSLISLPPPF